ncbi:DUF7738 domain-containing protein [Photobacterium sp. 53610]|uniref:DUF7738 domain-containing protein n=1 Tax=Photobacterium sp. 53610 TaxID=3102789 RepID=UPI002ED935D3
MISGTGFHVRLKVFSPQILSVVCMLLSAISVCKAESVNTSDQPVRLVITSETITFDGQSFRFEKPLKDWIQVLGDNYIQGERDSVAAFKSKRFIYPELGIDLEVQRNTKSPSSDWVNGRIGILQDPMSRYITDVRVYLTPEVKMNPDAIELKYKNHPFNTMFASYAINFYGAIVDHSVKKENVIRYGEGVAMDRHFNSVDANVSATHNATLLFDDFWGRKPEVPVMLEIYPSSKLKYENEVKYFGQIVSR